MDEEGGDVAELLLGPMLRTVERTAATVWMELDRPGEVEVLGHRATSFTVAGHHYAIVVVRGLGTGAEHPYDVRIDGERVWPTGTDDLPTPTIRTIRDHPYRILFGSCRAAAPEHPPWTAEPGSHPHARGHDALLTYTRSLIAGERERPDLMLWLGDQVYADDASPDTRRFVRSRRDVSRPPGEDVNDLAEYGRLYREAWSVPELRWLQASVPSAMIFDDHDVIDDWNISADWLGQMRRTDWWDERITSALASYWVHQHLGNLGPDELDADPLYAEIRSVDDGADVLRRMAREADRDPTSFRWSFDRWIGDDHIVVVDSRAARTFAPQREMLDPPEWEWLEDRLREPAHHLLLATSIPVVMPVGMVYGEMWSEAVAGGRWGRRPARWAERLRQKLDLERWGSFRSSFDRLMDDLRHVTGGDEAPTTALLLSGDIHIGYSAELSWPGAAHSPTWQLTASPMRNRIPPARRRLLDVADSPLGRAAGRLALATAGLRPPDVDWRIRDGPIADNHLAVLTLDVGRAHVRFDRVVGRAEGPARLETVFERDLGGER